MEGRGVMFALSCPWCSHIIRTRLPVKIPFINFYPAAIWAGFRFGSHVKSRHPDVKDAFFTVGEAKVMVEYVAENWGEKDDYTDEEIKEFTEMLERDSYDMPNQVIEEFLELQEESNA